MDSEIASEDKFQEFLGQTLEGRYRLDEILGTGGMGGVFRATHLGLDREVAVKILRPRFGDKGDTAKRFEREVYSASRLDHPNCVRVTDSGSTENGGRYLVMQLLEGDELFDLMGSPWPPARAVDLSLQMFRGLAHAHAQGIVHRDLKPANVFVTSDEAGAETAKLVDFGIAKLLNDGVFAEKLTRAGAIFGTPRYMSPEQASGGSVDARTDLYSAGLLLYQMLAGHPPFEAEGPATLLRMHVMDQPPPLPEGTPAALRAVVMHLLEKAPEDRIQTAADVVSALQGLRASLDGVPAAHKVEAALNAAASAPTAVGAAALSGGFVKPDTAPGGAGLPGSPSEPLAALGASARSSATMTSPYGWESGTLPAPAPRPEASVTSPVVRRGGTELAIPSPVQSQRQPPTPAWLVVGGLLLLAFLGIFGMWIAGVGASEADVGVEGSPDSAGGAAAVPDSESPTKPTEKKKKQGKKL